LSGGFLIGRETKLSTEKSGEKFLPGTFPRVRYGIDKLILVQKYKIHYVEAGQGQPVILMPGSANTHRMWSALMPLLAARFRLMAIDYIGRLDSEPTRENKKITLQEQTDILVKLVLQLELGQVNLIGGYNSGISVYDFAARYPDLVIKFIGIEADLIQTGPESGSDIDPQKIVDTRLSGLSDNSDRSIKEEAKSIKTPFLYLFGTSPDVKRTGLADNLKYLKTYLPHAWIVSLEGSILDLADQKPLEIAKIIVEFLNNKITSRNRPEIKS
jgi:hypothetical protein